MPGTQKKLKPKVMRWIHRISVKHIAECASDTCDSTYTARHGSRHKILREGDYFEKAFAARYTLGSANFRNRRHRRREHWSVMHRPSETSVSESSLSRLAVHHQLPDFALTNQHGHALSLADLEGNVWVADFIFTSCPLSVGDD